MVGLALRGVVGSWNSSVFLLPNRMAMCTKEGRIGFFVPLCVPSGKVYRASPAS